MNPGRGKQARYSPARVTVAVLTYVPNQVGYFQGRFAVMRACLESIIKHTEMPYDLMVFDNGSCPEVVSYLNGLHKAGKIRFLILSGENIGKIGALKMIFNAAPGEIVAYSDDDIFFLPGWLKKHLEVLDTYPKTGAVTGMYIKPHMKEGIRSTLSFSQNKDVYVEKGNLIAKDLEQHYIDQTGRTEERYRDEIQGIEDCRLTYRDVTTFVSAGHYQFAAPRKVILDALPSTWSGNLMGQMRDLDVAIDNLGYLRLCITPEVIKLLGNLIDEKAAAVIKEFGIQIEAEQIHLPGDTGLLKIPVVKKLAYFLYERLFRIINA